MYEYSGSDRSQTVDAKVGEMAEWLKAHAWKAILETLTKRYLHARTHNRINDLPL